MQKGHWRKLLFLGLRCQGKSGRVQDRTGKSGIGSKGRTNGRDTMHNMLLNLYVKFQNLKDSEEGQDLVEYALVVALIAFGATAGMKNLATGINTAFSNISSQLGSAMS